MELCFARGDRTTSVCGLFAPYKSAESWAVTLGLGWACDGTSGKQITISIIKNTIQLEYASQQVNAPS
jgi:hypothetical protein